MAYFNPFTGILPSDSAAPSIFDVQRRQALAQKLGATPYVQNSGPLGALAQALGGIGSSFESGAAANEAQLGQTQAIQGLQSAMNGGWDAYQNNPGALVGAMASPFLPEAAGQTANDWLKYQQQVNTPQYEMGGLNGQPPGFFIAGSNGTPTFQTFNPNAKPLGTTGSPTIDPSMPGYDDVVPGTMLTQRAIDQRAQEVNTTGQAASPGRSGISIQQATAINNRAAELANGGINLGAQHPQLTALTTALSAAQKNLSSVSTSMQNAENGFQQVLNAFNGKVNLSSYPSINAAVNASQRQLDPATITAYQNGLKEVANEYATVFSRNGQTTDAVRARAQSILDGDLNPSQLQQVLNELQQQAKIVIAGYQKNVDDLTTKIKGLGTPSSSSTSDTSRNDPLGIL